MKITLNKLFRLDPTPYGDEALVVLNKLYDLKKDRVKNFYEELMELPDKNDLSIDHIFDEHQNQKFTQNSMCLSLKNIKFLYQFFSEYKE